jgi:uncharacterized protein with von Willebrand factor type A (vWA) domain
MSKLTFRTSPPVSYIPPSRDEMKDMATKIGLKGFAPDLVADLTNLAAGGSVNPPSTYRPEVTRRAEEKLPPPDKDGDWKIPDKVKTLFGGRRNTKNRAEAVAARVEETMRYHQNVCDFLQTAELQKFPGGTPLEQAMSLLKLLSQKQGGEGAASEGGGEPLPIFADSERPEGVAESLHETMDMVESLSDEEMDMLDPNGEKHEIESEDVTKSGGQELNKLKVAEDLAEGSDKRVMLDISRQLDEFTKLQTRKQKKQEVDPAGEEVRQRPIRHLGELSRVSPSAWATRQQSPSLFLYRAVTGQLNVRERVTTIEKKQAIFILVDGSGSMSGKKHWKATGVVMNRLKAVISGDAVVYVSVFDTAMTRVECASTPEEARALIKKFSAKNFSGGGTDIAAAVRSAHKYIEKAIAEGAALYRPEVVVLTDEDTSITGLKKSEIPGTRVHGFAMEVANPSLVEFARSTGGVGVDKF